MTRAGRSKTSALVAALTGTVVALLAVELLFRTFAPQPLALSYLTPLGLTLHIPGARIRYARGEFDHEIAINSLGLRDHEWICPKPAGTFRILVLGDSFVEGKQVPLEQTFAKRIEAGLTAAHPDRRWEVVNAGVAGYGTADEIKYFEVYGRDLGADLVILGFFVGNDVLNNALSPFFGWTNGKLTENPLRPLSRSQLIRSRIKEFFTSHFHFVQFLRDRMREIPVGSAKPATENDSTPAESSESTHDESAWAFTDALIDRLHGLVVESGAGFLLVAIPSRFQVAITQGSPPGAPLGLDVAWPQRLLETFARSRGMPFLDLLPALSDAARVAPTYFHVDAHFNARGHAIAAQEILQALTRQGLVSGASIPQSAGS